MYIEIIAVGSKRFVNTDAIVSIDVGKTPPDSDVLLTLSSGEVLIINDEATKNKLTNLLN
jgi:hypothetical protein